MSEKRTMLINTINRTLKNVVLGAGFAQLSVRSVSEDVDGGRIIINLSACTDYQKAEIMKALRAKDSLEDFSEDELQSIANINATYSFPTEWLMRENKPFVPETGDAVKALFVKKFSENQKTEILVVDRLQSVGDASTSATSIDAIFGGEELSTEVESEASKIAEQVTGA